MSKRKPSRATTVPAPASPPPAEQAPAPSSAPRITSRNSLADKGLHLGTGEKPPSSAPGASGAPAAAVDVGPAAPPIAIGDWVTWAPHVATAGEWEHGGAGPFRVAEIYQNPTDRLGTRSARLEIEIAPAAQWWPCGELVRVPAPAPAVQAETDPPRARRAAPDKDLGDMQRADVAPGLEPASTPGITSPNPAPGEDLRLVAGEKPASSAPGITPGTSAPCAPPPPDRAPQAQAIAPPPPNAAPDTEIAPVHPSQAIAPSPAQQALFTPPQRRRLPDERQSLTRKLELGGFEGYLTIGMYPDGSPGEVFILMSPCARALTPSEAASLVRGLCDGLAIAWSIALQYGAPMGVIAEKFMHTRFEPSALGVSSLLDLIARKVLARFSSPKTEP